MKVILFSLIFISSLSAANDSVPQVKKAASGPSGYSQVWVKIENPERIEGSRERPLELSLPLCNKKSVRKLDEYCFAPDGSIARVTAIRGEKVAYERVDLKTGSKFSKFAAALRPLGASRMPASYLDVEVVCEASCPQMDFTNQCRASAATREKASRELASVFAEKQNQECKNCNLKTIVCDGKVYSDRPNP